VNNAGVMIHDRAVSVDGHDANTATNTLGTYALTALMAPCLAKCADSRVITVSSGGMYTVPLEVADIDNKKGGKYDGTVPYAKDKRRQVWAIL
jgi:dehydrogenase/reductase SDR family protein 12